MSKTQKIPPLRLRLTLFDEQILGFDVAASSAAPPALVDDFACFAHNSAPAGLLRDTFGTDALRALSALTELQRHQLLDAFCHTCAAPAEATLWQLGSGLAAAGRYRLAAGVFLYGSELAYRPDRPVMRAALLAKAGATLNTGGYGRMAEQLLAGTLASLRRTEEKLRTLVESYAYFHLARRQIFRDNLTDADAMLREAERKLLLFDAKAQGDVPEMLLLDARIVWGRAEIFGHRVDQRHLLGLLNRVEVASDRSWFFPPLPDHHIMYGRAVVMRLAGDLDGASDEARRALALLTANAERSTAESAKRPRNTRREGYIHALLGDIAADRRKLEEALVEYRLAHQLWSQSFYPRGMSRAARDQGRCLIALGRNWSEASRLLNEAVTNARSIGCRGSEARAMAVRLCLHRQLGHATKAKGIEDQIASLTRNSPDISPLLGRLRDGERRGLERAWSPLGEDAWRHAERLELLTPSIAMMDCLAELQANPAEKLILVLSEPGLKLAHVAEFIARGRALPLQLYRLRSAGAALPTERPSPDRMLLVVMTQADHIRVQHLARVKQWASNHPVILCIEGPEAGMAATRAKAAKHLGASRTVVVPSLRQRKGDIPFLGQRFLAAQQMERVRTLSTDAWNYLACYDWPGNVDQLQAAMAQLAQCAAGEAGKRDVGEGGELLLEFVASRTANIWKQTPAAVGPATAGQEVLSRGIPITVEALRDFCRKYQLQAVSDVARQLQINYGYAGAVTSLVRQINRKGKEKFRLAVITPNP